MYETSQARTRPNEIIRSNAQGLHSTRSRRRVGLFSLQQGAQYQLRQGLVGGLAETRRGLSIRLTRDAEE